MRYEPSDIVIVSYPRSGNTWLRFLMANMYFPDIDHDFQTVHKLMPALDSDEMDNWQHVYPQFFKSHADMFEPSFPRVIYMYRHVGDVMISMFHYLRKYYNLDDDMEKFLSDTDYGADWRSSVNNWFPKCENKPQNYQVLPYEALLDNPELVLMVLRHFVGIKIKTEISDVVKKCQFDKLRDIEEKKGLLKHTNPGIKFFRTGKKDQWRELPARIQRQIRKKNVNELSMLQYLDT